MTQDYPDYTDLMQIIGADIMVPIDIQGAYIMMPVDIQAQYINLAIDIVAQTVGNIAIDIAAATMGNILVDIKAQTIGNLTIDIEAQSIGVHLQPDWAALQGVDKDFRTYGDGLSSGEAYSADYVVPSDPIAKTLWICGASFSLFADGAADRDLPQQTRILLLNLTDTIYLATVGGNGGGSVVLPKPLAIPSGKTFRYGGWNMSNHTATGEITAWGYETID